MTVLRSRRASGWSWFELSSYCWSFPRALQPHRRELCRGCGRVSGAPNWKAQSRTRLRLVVKRVDLSSPLPGRATHYTGSEEMKTESTSSMSSIKIKVESYFCTSYSLVPSKSTWSVTARIRATVPSPRSQPIIVSTISWGRVLDRSGLDHWALCGERLTPSSSSRATRCARTGRGGGRSDRPRTCPGSA